MSLAHDHRAAQAVLLVPKKYRSKKFTAKFNPLAEVIRSFSPFAVHEQQDLHFKSSQTNLGGSKIKVQKSQK